MKEKLPIDNILFVDVETVSEFATYDEMPENIKPFWEKKATYQKEYNGENSVELYKDKAAIFSEFGKIIVISIGQLYYNTDYELNIKTKSFYSNNENEILKEFSELLKKYGSRLQLCGHNSKEFDIPYIGRRMIVNSLQLPDVLDLSGKKPWEVNHIDTMDLWKFGDRKNFTSLDLLANILNIPSSKSIMNGSEVGEYYYDKNDIKSIAEYCEQDVITTAKLFLRLKYPDKQIDM